MKEIEIPEGYEARIEGDKVIFEPKESEDERIRKALIHLINEQDGFLTAINGISVKDIIAYLEKQKEPLTHTEAYMKGFSDGCEAQRDSYRMSEEPKPIISAEERLGMSQGEYNKIVDECIYGKQKEQQPLSTQETELNSIAFLEQMGYTCIPPGTKPAEWSEEDKNKLYQVLETLLADKTMALRENPHCKALHRAYDELIDFLKSLPERFNLQPKQECSEEDEKILNEIIAIMDGRIVTSGRYLSEYATWLKSLHPQPKSEIYKSAKHDLAIRFMNYLDENRPDGKMSLSSGECEDIDKAFKENDWAKIMRYAEKYSPSWKPSKEQMRVFLKATPINLMPEELPVYNSLYDDLQKLL